MILIESKTNKIARPYHKSQRGYYENEIMKWSFSGIRRMFSHFANKFLTLMNYNEIAKKDVIQILNSSHKYMSKI